MSVFLLPKPCDGWKPLPVKKVFLPNATETTTAFKNIVGAGRAYNTLVYGLDQISDGPEECADIADANADIISILKTKLENPDLDIGNYYALFGFEDLMFDTTVEQIKERYPLVSLVCHPDKANQDNRDYAEKRYKAIQRAYETFQDKSLRREYDSSMPFNDSIPKASQITAKKSFYDVFGPVFKRNSRFSENTPAPQLGDENTPDDDVNSFYDFWFGFKSWREFTHLDTHKPEQATDRDEKRWMERENKKVRAGLKKEEVARVRKFVELAEKFDPRIKNMKIKAEEEKKRRKAEKNKDKDQAKAAEEARKKAEEEAKKKAEEEAAIAAAAQKVDKKSAARALKKLRSTLRKAVAVHRDGNSAEAVASAFEGVKNELLNGSNAAAIASVLKEDDKADAYGGWDGVIGTECIDELAAKSKTEDLERLTQAAEKTLSDCIKGVVHARAIFGGSLKVEDI